MAEQFGDDFITLTDDEGKEFEVEVLATVEHEGAVYLALIPADTPEDADLEVSILKQIEEDGEEILVTVDDDDELQAVYDKIMDLIYEEEEEDK